MAKPLGGSTVGYCQSKYSFPCFKFEVSSVLSNRMSTFVVMIQGSVSLRLCNILRVS